MRVWVDLANSPHVPLFVPIVARLRAAGHSVVLTARDHAQTLELALREWPEVLDVGGHSPSGRLAKGLSIIRRAWVLREIARDSRPDVALSHASYAQVIAARAERVPSVTMMDYEHQPANHVSFRLAQKVLVPSIFPEVALRRFGAHTAKVVRYPGFKEQLYLTHFVPDLGVLDELELDRDRVIAVFRPPPEGALYHRAENVRFEELVRVATAASDVQVIVLPRNRAQAERLRSKFHAIRIPDHAVDASSLLALADVVIGAGGTMNRESAILGTPTYTVFVGPLAAVDAELIRQGRLYDLRVAGTPRFEKKLSSLPSGTKNGERILEAVLRTVKDVVMETQAADSFAR
jgi:predicted glycosyltransferase